MKLSRVLITVIVSTVVACTTSYDGAENLIDKCPQPRFTEKAPSDVYSLVNPVRRTAASIESGEDLFMDASGKVTCMDCHGEKGDGDGAMSSMFDPPPRNFSCAKTIDGVPDGQLFWIIKNGSPGTSMPAFDHLSDKDLWQLVHYIRKLSKQSSL